MEATFQFCFKRMVCRLSQILQTAVGSDTGTTVMATQVLGERKQQLPNQVLLRWPPQGIEPGWHRGDAQACQCGLTGSAVHLVIQFQPQWEKLRIDSIKLLKIGVQARGMIPDIANAEDEIGSELMLDFKAPVLDHSGPAITGPGEAGSTLKITIQQRGILVKGGRREGGEPGIQGTLPSHQYRGEAVCR